MKKRYSVVFTESARHDIYTSYEWGVRRWGLAQAQRGARELRATVEKILRVFPLSQPLAPESEDTNSEIRQVIVGRYRVLFMVDGADILVLHVRGAFLETLDP